MVLDVLHHVRVRAHHRAGTCVDHQPGQLALPIVGEWAVFFAPVHEGDDDVGVVHRAGTVDVGHHLFVFASGHAGVVVASFEVAGEKIVVAQQGDPLALALDDQRRMGFAQRVVTAEVGHARLLQAPQHLGEGAAPEITGMVVGQGHGIDMPLEQGQHTRWARKV